MRGERVENKRRNKKLEWKNNRGRREEEKRKEKKRKEHFCHGGFERDQAVSSWGE